MPPAGLRHQHQWSGQSACGDGDNRILLIKAGALQRHCAELGQELHAPAAKEHHEHCLARKRGWHTWTLPARYWPDSLLEPELVPSQAKHCSRPTVGSPIWLPQSNASTINSASSAAHSVAASSAAASDLSEPAGASAAATSYSIERSKHAAPVQPFEPYDAWRLGPPIPACQDERIAEARAIVEYRTPSDPAVGAPGAGSDTESVSHACCGRSLARPFTCTLSLALLCRLFVRRLLPTHGFHALCRLASGKLSSGGCARVQSKFCRCCARASTWTLARAPCSPGSASTS